MATFKDVFGDSSYSDRIRKVSDAVKDSIDFDRSRGEKSDVDKLIRHHSSDTLEGRLGGRAFSDFHKDVKKSVSSHVGSANRSLAAKNRSQNLQSFHQKLAQVINDGIGHSYPDGDPIDYIHPRAMTIAHSHGIDTHYDISDHLDKASRHNGYDNYHHQLSSTWDELGPVGQDAADASARLHHYHNNPWTDREPLDPTRPDHWLALKKAEKS